MTQDYKECPYCGEQIRSSAKKCRFCGEFLTEDGNACECREQTPGSSPLKYWWVVVLLVGAVSACMLLLSGRPSDPSTQESEGTVPAIANESSPETTTNEIESLPVCPSNANIGDVPREEVKAIQTPPPEKRITRRRLEPEATRRLSETPQIIKTTITTTGRGSNAKWGFEFICSFVLNYAVVCKAQIVEKSETAAGEVKVVEERHYLQAGQDLQLSKTDIKIAIAKTVDLGKVSGITSVICGVVDWVGCLFGQESAGDIVRKGFQAVVGAFDGMDGRGLYSLVSKIGFAPDTAEAEMIAKSFLDNLAKDIFKSSELQGKSYRIVYYQDKESGEPLRVDFTYADGRKIQTADEWMVLRRANAFMDAQIIPNRSCSPGDSWTVNAADFDCLLDPYVDGRYEGQVSVDRQDNDEDGNWVLHLSPSDVNLVSDQGRTSGNVHLAEGKAQVDGENHYIKAMVVVGNGAMKNLNEHHLLFKSQMEGQADFRALLTCEPAE